MKNILKYIAAAAVLLVVVGANAQEKAQLTRVHPDITKYTEMYQLDEKQVKDLTAIYSETSKEGMKVEEEMKTTQIKHRETIKTATPAEREKMKGEIDVLAQKRQMIKMERERRMISLLNEDQLKNHKQNQAKEGQMQRGNVKKQEMIKQEAVKSAK